MPFPLYPLVVEREDDLWRTLSTESSARRRVGTSASSLTQVTTLIVQ